MSISGISSNTALNQSLQAWQVRAQKLQSEFQQLGQDLQAGNLSQAQADFGLLRQNISNPAQSNSTVAQAFSALGTALQSGSVAAAQQAYSTLQQDVQQTAQGHHHHHRLGSDVPTSGSSATGAFSQLLSSLGSALQAGNLSAAQTAYSTLTQGFRQLGGIAGAISPSLAAPVSVLA